MSRKTGKWDKTLDLKDIWDRNIPESEMPELGKIIAKRLRLMYNEKFLRENYDLEEIILNLESILSPEEIATGEYCIPSTTDDFNEQFRQLYDWADYDKRLWIAINYI